MSAAQVEARVRALVADLRRLAYPHAVPRAALLEGHPAVLLAVLGWALLACSAAVRRRVEALAGPGAPLDALRDAEFAALAARFQRDVLGARPELQAGQLLSRPGAFVERKLAWVGTIVAGVLRLHQQPPPPPSRRQQPSSPPPPRALDVSSAAVEPAAVLALLRGGAGGGWGDSGGGGLGAPSPRGCGGGLVRGVLAPQAIAPHGGGGLVPPEQPLSNDPPRGAGGATQALGGTAAGGSSAAGPPSPVAVARVGSESTAAAAATPLQSEARTPAGAAAAVHAAAAPSVATLTDARGVLGGGHPSDAAAAQLRGSGAGGGPLVHDVAALLAAVAQRCLATDALVARAARALAGRAHGAPG